ncbi:MAG TPA: glycosyltransferase family A protein [Gemmataceae bacterium]|nr:glycosyltransferase family A protein [Gemmataceae bacterium]
MSAGARQASVSVIMPTYNCSRFIAEALDSILAQSVRPSEIIVVDDGSTDDTAARLAPYLAHIRYERQENRGVSAARNNGVGRATGEFVAFLDADDVWHPRKLELQLRALADNPGLALLGTGIFAWPTTAFPEIDVRSHGRVIQVTWPELVVKNALGTSSIVVRAEILRRAGEFDTRMHGSEDRDLWLRVAEMAPVGNLELPLMGLRALPGSLSRRARTCQTGMLRLLQKLDGRGAWKGRRLLRRKAYSYVHHSCSLIWDEAGERRTALLACLKSFLWYPLPYRRPEAALWLERPRRFLVILLRLLGLKPAVPEPVPELVDERGERRGVPARIWR